MRTFGNGGKVANFSLATSENWRDRQSGERREKTEWHRVVIFNEQLGKVAEQYLKKGAKVYLEGQLQTRSWEDQSGQKKYTTEIVLQRYRGELQMLDSRGQGGDGGGSYGGGDDRFGQQSPNQVGGGSQGGNRGGFGGGGELDDEIPF